MGEKSKVDAAVEHIRDFVDDEIAPDAMSPEEALETVEQAIADLEATADGLRSDLQEG